MTTTFKELPCHAQFTVSNIDEIICNRGDGLSVEFYRNREVGFYSSKHSRSNYPFIKRDEFGGHILICDSYFITGVYYRIEPNNEVETV